MRYKPNRSSFLVKYFNLLSIISILIFLIACSPQKNYQVLTIFFDDVPPPDTTKIVADSTNITNKIINENDIKKELLVEKTHPPAEEGSCNNCHDVGNSFKLNEMLPKLCNNCHEDFSKKNKFLHGPLSVGACTICHDPHKSRFKSFLKQDGQALCYFCHEKESVMKNDIHSTIEDTKCWECHNPHGGNERTFMK